MSADQATVMTLDADHMVGLWRDVELLLWRGEVELDAVVGLRDAIETLVTLRPRGIALFVIIEETSKLPSGEARRRMAQLLRDYESYIVASCIAMEGAGFRAAAVRSVLTGISFVARPKCPHGVFASVGAACEWLAAVRGHRMAHAFTGAELCAAIHEVRTRIGTVDGTGRAVSDIATPRR